MREIYAEIASRLREGRPCAVATLIATRNASPAPIGTSILIDADGSFTGNIGAGCHESDIVEAARLTLRDEVNRVLEFDMHDELIDGSACGASLEVAIWKPAPEFASTAEQIVAGEETVLFSCAARVVAIAPKRRLLVVGATHLASHLARLARACDFHVTVIDPRPAFATRVRQPDADDLMVAWPNDPLPRLLESADAVVVLAHDVKIDLPALRCALDSHVPYIGALGSRRSQQARRSALSELGYDEPALERIRGPVGLDVGSVTDAQISCSIVAEMLGVLNARSGRPLKDGLLIRAF